MNRYYFDNAATSYPKPKAVPLAIVDYIENIGSNVGRGTFEDSYKAGRVVYETREELCRIFNYNNPLNVVFTLNITESLNILIKGLLNEEDKVLVTSMEHNAVMRPLRSKALGNINVLRLPCDAQGNLILSELEKFDKRPPKAIVMTHVSNVCGTIMPIKKVGEFCRKHNTIFIVDTAQSAGVLDIDMEEYNIDALAFTGHKGLLGPQGTGGFIIKEKLVEVLRTFKEGGTGSFSEDEEHPSIMPDKFESGTLNIPGIYGLNASLKFLKDIGINTVREKEIYLGDMFLNSILNIDGVKVVGIQNMNNRTAVFSLTINDMDPSEVSFILDRHFNIMTRSGLHCSPSAHKTLGTFPQGTVRVSFGYFNETEDIKYLCDALNKVSKKIY